MMKLTHLIHTNCTLLKWMGCVFLLLLIVPDSKAQHGSHWLLGLANEAITVPNFEDFRTGLIDFRTTPPTISYYNDKDFAVNNANMVIADSSGNPLFFTNMMSIYNMKGDYLVNGDTINNGEVRDVYEIFGYPVAYSYGGLPLADNKYFIFYPKVEEEDKPAGVSNFSSRYAIIDPYFNNGQGKVLIKDQAIDTNNLAGVVAIKHGNGRDWILHMAFTYYNAIKIEYKQYLLNYLGQITYLNGSSLPYVYNSRIQDAFNETGSKFYTLLSENVTENDKQTLVSNSFDRCTGQIKNDKIQYFNHAAYLGSLEVSPNGKYLYGSDYINVMQFNLEETTTQINPDTISALNGFFNMSFGHMRKAHDGTIYTRPAVSGPTALNVIHTPDLPGTAADLELNAYLLDIYDKSLPPVFINYQLGALKGSPCDTLEFPLFNKDLFIKQSTGEICLVFKDVFDIKSLKCRIYDSVGDTVLEEEFDQNSQNFCLNTTNLISGQYTVRVWLNDDKMVQKTIQIP